MCAIFASFSSVKLKQLYDINSYRGTVSGSLAVVDTHGIAALKRIYGTISDDDFRALGEMDTSGLYFIGHTQAPTSQEVDTKTIHPSVYETRVLWHNGIIKPKTIDMWNAELETHLKWDTDLLNHIIAERGFEFLSEVNGSFACLLNIGDEFFVFRNEIAPLFYDEHLNISSTMFDRAEPVPPNKVFRLNFKFVRLDDIGLTFATAENPFFFGV